MHAVRSAGGSQTPGSAGRLRAIVRNALRRRCLSCPRRPVAGRTLGRQCHSSCPGRRWNRRIRWNRGAGGRIRAAPAVDMEALRAEIGRDGAYMGQGAKTRAAILEKRYGTRSADTPSPWKQPTRGWRRASRAWTSAATSPQLTGLPSTTWAPGSRTSRPPREQPTGTPSSDPSMRGASSAGLIRGAYHFALPNVSSAGPGELLRQQRRRLDRGRKNHAARSSTSNTTRTLPSETPATT